MDSNQTDSGLTLDFDDDIKITLGDMTDSGSGLYTWDSGYGAILQNNLSPITINGSWNNNTAPSWSFTDANLAPLNSGKIFLSGDDADIEINGESVIGMLKDIRDRLNILQVSEEMEQEWDDLRILREQYEAKLAECREKSRAWKALKQPG